MTAYAARHRDTTPAAEARCAYLDSDVKAQRWLVLFPCRHYHAKHTAVVCKVRGEAA